MYQDQSILAKLGRAGEMLAGLAAHSEQLSRRGIDTDFITKMNSTQVKAMDAHNARLGYKARMMEKRAEREQYMTELMDLYSEARKQVKLELPPETWREFGIVDQR
jgi:hypothetical protein